MKSVCDYYVLKNGVNLPCIGFGTWKIQEEEAKEQVLKALRAGYRHIDTAAFYGNEKGIGEALRQTELKREEIFITSKVWNDDQGYEECKEAFQKSLERLGIEYLDMYLIHWPIAYAHRENWSDYVKATWKAMEELYEEGRIRAIGVCNFMPHHLEPLMENCSIEPMVNQIEFHPGLLQEETVAYCKSHDIQIEAWAPLARQAILEVEELKDIAHQYGRTIAQITLRWELQKGIVPLPKSSNYERMIENRKIFDFELTQEDMERIDQIKDCEGSGQHPDYIKF
ncbi:MAG: aldo/keto reductase [Lachnospiraceae bacterium]|nr:aldo/keto reductase [Lachnospiraceae bacterium]